MDYSVLPTLNAILNATSGLLVILGYLSIKRSNKKTHKRFMLSAFAVSALFFASYIVYHWNVGSVKFQGAGTIRYVYFTILISHTLMAVAIVPLVLRTLYLALKGNFQKHRKIAKITFPSWVFVSVSGVVVYFMLYQF